MLPQAGDHSPSARRPVSYTHLIAFAGKDTQLLASSPRKLFLEKTEAYNAQVKAAIEQACLLYTSTHPYLQSAC